MTRVVKYARKIVVGVVGTVVLIIGIILIPVPGPGGLPVCLAGLLILSLEFDGAKPYVERLKKLFKSVAQPNKRPPKK